MAERRMFSKTILQSDAFLDMPSSTQMLYVQMSLLADDDGFLNNPKKVQRMVGCNDDDMKLLLAKRFILGFESGIVVVKHWRVNNYLQKDRHKATVHQKEYAMLDIKDNKSYTFKSPGQHSLDTECIHSGYGISSGLGFGKENHQTLINVDESTNVYKSPGQPIQDTESIHDVYTLDTQVRLGKVRLGKDRKDKTALPILEKDDEAPTQFVLDTIAVLNEITGKNFATPTGAAFMSIRRLFDQGRTIEDVRQVVSIKNDEWKDNPRMSAHIRPSTLFGEHFDEYLNQQAGGDCDEIDPEFANRF